MDQNFSVDDFFSGDPCFLTPSRLTWQDFCDFIDDEIIDDEIIDDLKGDSNES